VAIQRLKTWDEPLPTEGDGIVEGEVNPLLTGKGIDSWECNGCNDIVLENVEVNQVAGKIFKCAECEELGYCDFGQSLPPTHRATPATS